MPITTSLKQRYNLGYSKASFPPSCFTDLVQLSKLCLHSLRHYVIIRREGASLQQRKPNLCFPISILHPISQFCPFAGGTSWWTTVTQPPQGILMMNSAMTFSLGNLASSFFFPRWWLDKPQKRVITSPGLSTWLIPLMNATSSQWGLKRTCRPQISHFQCVHVHVSAVLPQLQQRPADDGSGEWEQPDGTVFLRGFPFRQAQTPEDVDRVFALRH